MAQSRNTRYGLRSNTVDLDHPPEHNPESILRDSRQRRKAKNPTQTQSQIKTSAYGHPDKPIQSIETLLAQDYSYSEHGAHRESSNEERSLVTYDTDPEATFNLRWGYLPPLDEEVAVFIDSILRDSGMARDYGRTGPENKMFPLGLTHRNVFTMESVARDPYVDRITSFTPKDTIQETEGETDSYERLWAQDQAQCREGSNEAFFQRTLMMSLVARHCLIYKEDVTKPRVLDFSVEEVWSCPPMPTRAYQMGHKFLTQPKPDLAVCFCRQNLIPGHLWNNMPISTQRLACFENTSETGASKVFHFFTIEAKKAMISADDTVGKRQSLNNASQALHNMFEFFRDAGPQYEKSFYAKVRFFSVVASTEGLTIRIHRATQEPADGSDQGFIMPSRPDYPLRFEYQEFARIHKDKFNRETVFRIFKKILIHYGVHELHILLQEAAKAIMKKLNNDPEQWRQRGNSDFYRYGQTSIPTTSRQQTPTASRAESTDKRISLDKHAILQNGMPGRSQSRASSKTDTSIDMLRSGTSTPTQSRAPIPTQALNLNKKRLRSQPED